eukprot:3395584-Prymnesium_polylepis.3
MYSASGVGSTPAGMCHRLAFACQHTPRLLTRSLSCGSKCTNTKGTGAPAVGGVDAATLDIGGVEGACSLSESCWRAAAAAVRLMASCDCNAATSLSISSFSNSSCATVALSSASELSIGGVDAVRSPGRTAFSPVSHSRGEGKLAWL